ncbi:exopolysaccharide biosynthesis protein [Gracilimonas mengyeensis]|uniref:exopolysaccharide biosynthesis protein n=1 Tax=Gracilimonas mengyeensis TaxID=1302730 RepID=UPI001C8F5BCF|nr:exopolysaccharide biosynthesis protein [Gracilimonas mengyeensis]
MYKPASYIDRWLKVRLTPLVQKTGQMVIAVICSLIALCLPFMEVIPFSANVAGLAFTFFGLSLITHDGLLALLALIAALGTFGIVVFGLL